VTRRGLTLVELLAALTLLSLVAGACVSWITAISRGSLPTIEARIAESDLDDTVLFIEELTLRSTDDRWPRLDQQGRALLPARWWVSVSSRDEVQLATWARLELHPMNQTLMVTFMDEQFQQIAEPRQLLAAVHALNIEQVHNGEHSEALILSIETMTGETRQLSLPMGSTP